ncbi:MAG TPA: hypothetical protein VNF04_06695 [Stellaceae bacterium]|nr:hypothetical protein [Stellaceae bacterium]
MLPPFDPAKPRGPQIEAARRELIYVGREAVKLRRQLVRYIDMALHAAGRRDDAATMKLRAARQALVAADAPDPAAAAEALSAALDAIKRLL